MQYIADRSRDGMSEEQWREATRFDGTDWGWVIMSIGMAIRNMRLLRSCWQRSHAFA